MNKKKILIIGHARHGKDTVAEMFHELHGYTFKSSSIAASEIFLYDKLKEKYNYSSPEECFEDRVNHRAEWHDLICEYNLQDKARLAKDILNSSDIYVGMRSNVELEECCNQNIFDYIIGVYDPNKDLESEDSFDIDMWLHADFIIPNSGTLEDLRRRVYVIGEML